MTAASIPDLLLLAAAVNDETDVTTRLVSLRHACRTAGLLTEVCDYRTWFSAASLHEARHIHLLDPVAACAALATRPSQTVRTILRTLKDCSFSVSVTQWPGHAFSFSDDFLGECLWTLFNAASHILLPQGRIAACAVAEPAWKDRLSGVMPAMTPLSTTVKEAHVEAEKRLSHALQPGGRLLLFGGRIERAAQLERFARVTARLRAHIPDVHAVVIGPVADALYAADILPVFRDSGCTYAGAWGRAAMRGWIERATVVWHPGDSLEPSLVSLEALDLGRPALVSRACAVAWPEASDALLTAVSDAQSEELIARLLLADERGHGTAAAGSAALRRCALDLESIAALFINSQHGPARSLLTLSQAMR